MEKKTKLKMKSTSWFLRSSTIYFFISLVRSTGSTQPLIFDPYTVQVYNSEPGLEDSYAVACPVSSENEKIFNDDKSFDRKALFVKNYHSSQDDFPIQQEICETETSVQLAVVYHRNNRYKEIQFGYEVYAESDALPANSYVSKYEDYSSFSQGPGTFRKFLNNNITRKINLIRGKKEMSFIWIEKVSIRYNYRHWNIKEVRYEIFRNADQMNVLKCHNYDLANEVYEGENFDNYYSLESRDQKENVFRMAASKYNLLFPYNFKATPSSPISCSNLTTVPIYYSEATMLLRYLEHFLIAIGQITKNPLKIHSGIYGKITETTVDETNPETDTVYLDRKNKKLRVPQVIYKIVRYQSHKCESKKHLCWFEVAIIIHNESNVENEDLLCPKDKCAEWGWDNIQYTNLSTTREGEKSKHIYCCRFDQALKQKFGFTDKSVVEDLNLKDFPDYDETKKDNIYINMQEDFEKQMNEVLSKSKFYELPN